MLTPAFTARLHAMMPPLRFLLPSFSTPLPSFAGYFDIAFRCSRCLLYDDISMAISPLLRHVAFVDAALYAPLFYDLLAADE